MAYYKLKNTCDNYNEPSTALTCNKKYINPFLENSKEVAVYDTYNFELNSFEYLNNNIQPQTKSYNNFDISYEHYVSKLLNKRDQLIKREEKLIRAKEKKLMKEEEVLEKRRKELKEKRKTLDKISPKKSPKK